MLFFTWNLHRSDTALREAFEYLHRRAASTPLIACFQELPPANGKKKHEQRWRRDRVAVEKELRLLVPPSLRLASTIVGPGRVALVYTPNFRIAGMKIDGSKRMLVTRFRDQNNELVVAGYHAVDNRSVSHEPARGGHQALVRRELDEARAAFVPLVVLGDFNASPRAYELADRACFYAMAPGDPAERDERHYGRVHPPLFIVDAAVTPPASGTTFWGRWGHYDMVVVSAELRKRVSARVLNDLDGVSLLVDGPSGRPNRDKYSDHLPVLAELQ